MSLVINNNNILIKLLTLRQLIYLIQQSINQSIMLAINDFDYSLYCLLQNKFTLKELVLYLSLHFPFE